MRDMSSSEDPAKRTNWVRALDSAAASVKAAPVHIRTSQLFTAIKGVGPKLDQACDCNKPLLEVGLAACVVFGNVPQQAGACT